MHVRQHAPHFTVNEWRIVHTWTCLWTCSWIWSSSWFPCVSCSETDTVMQTYAMYTSCSPSSTSSRTSCGCSLFLLFLFFTSVRLEARPCPGISSSPSCWLWSFLAPRKESCMGNGDSCRSCFCCLVLSHLHTLHQQAVPTCP